MSLNEKAKSDVLKGKVANPDVIHGKSAYEIAVMHGFDGTEEEWLESLTEQTKKNAEEVIAEADKQIDNIKVAEQEAVSHIESMAEDALDIVQTTGYGETVVMSQKAVTDELSAMQIREEFVGSNHYIAPCNGNDIEIFDFNTETETSYEVVACGVNVWRYGDLELNPATGAAYAENMFALMKPDTPYVMHWDFISDGTEGTYSNKILVYYGSTAMLIENGKWFTITQEQKDTFLAAYAYFNDGATEGRFANVQLQVGYAFTQFEEYRQKSVIVDINTPRPIKLKSFFGVTNIVSPYSITAEAQLDTRLFVESKISEAHTKNLASYGLPVLNLFGDVSEMTKDNAVPLTYVYGNRSGVCTVKWQGTSSVGYPKKNYTVNFDIPFEAAEGWGIQKKYCLKANYIDFSHSRNIVSAKLWGDVVKSRATANERLNALANGGGVDGFPIIVYVNGAYQGIYTFNIPKDGWMFGMGSGSYEGIVCAEADWNGSLLKAEVLCDGNDFSIEYATDENNTAWIPESLNRLIRALNNSNGTDLDTTIAQYLDWDSAIDYLASSLLFNNFDGVAKNYLLATFDGVKWLFSAYDMDSTFGLWWTGREFMSASTHPSAVISSFRQHKVFDMICNYKKEQFKARYKTLRDGVLSEDAVATRFANFVTQIPKGLFDYEVEVWTGIPSTSTNNLSQIVDFYRRRCEYVDKVIDEL